MLIQTTQPAVMRIPCSRTPGSKMNKLIHVQNSDSSRIWNDRALRSYLRVVPWLHWRWPSYTARASSPRPSSTLAGWALATCYSILAPSAHAAPSIRLFRREVQIQIVVPCHLLRHVLCALLAINFAGACPSTLRLHPGFAAIHTSNLCTVHVPHRGREVRP